MAYFLNNDFKNNEFELASRDKFFVDKTSLIEKINSLIGIKDRFVCITRPRRFGKTLNAMMLASYYSKNADFKYLFDKLKVSKSDSYLEHLNKHNVIYMTFNQMPSAFPNPFPCLDASTIRPLYAFPMKKQRKKQYPII